MHKALINVIEWHINKYIPKRHVAVSTKVQTFTPLTQQSYRKRNNIT